jgi:hypothetical protein
MIDMAMSIIFRGILGILRNLVPLRAFIIARIPGFEVSGSVDSPFNVPDCWFLDRNLFNIAQAYNLFPVCREIVALRSNVVFGNSY